MDSLPVKIAFWRSGGKLIRVRYGGGTSEYPEVWRNGRWRVGTPYDMDAITGMGEDAYSCGETADSLSVTEAAEFAGVPVSDLYADNPDDPRSIVP